MKVVALIATYNDEHFIATCLEHLFDHGVEVYIVDYESTDRTVEFAQRYKPEAPLTIEFRSRSDGISSESQTARKEELALCLDADWFLHIDSDELPLPPRMDTTLADHLNLMDKQGHNAIRFTEYVFIPSRERPRHDRNSYIDTMCWYYPFMPTTPPPVRAWKRQPERVTIDPTFGQSVSFEGMKVCEKHFPLKHYLYLTQEHAVSKYHDKPDELIWELGATRKAERLSPHEIYLPRSSELKLYVSDEELNPANPRTSRLVESREAEWDRRLEATVDALRDTIENVIPSGDALILVDDNQIGINSIGDARRTFPFLERDGRYWGLPPDDEVAILELERLRTAGANFLIFTWPCFWWLTHYASFKDHLLEHYLRIVKEDNLIVFDLRIKSPL